MQIIALLFLPCLFIEAQAIKDKQYGVSVIRSPKAYHKLVKNDNNQQMVDIEKIVPLVVFDLRYAGDNNFMHKALYPTLKTSWLRLPVARALLKVQLELGKQSLGIKIFDAYRPYAVTKKMWELIHDDRYVADPHKGSGHNRGIAVDLTLINLVSKQELDMGTGFDNFTDSAHQTFTQLPAAVLQNRKLLKEIMERNGFKALETEWWHFSWAKGEEFEVLDIPFKVFQKN